MTPPPFLLGATLLFWGWQSQLLYFALVMVIILEGVHRVSWRLALSDKDFNRITDITAILLLLSLIYFFNQQAFQGLMSLLKWLPLLCFPLITAQIYSTQGTIKLSSLFLSLRHYEIKGIDFPSIPRIDLRYPYMMMCLLAASIAYKAGFFLGIALLISWALWKTRPQRHQPITWSILLAIVLSLAYLGQWNLHRLQREVEKLMLDWFGSYWQYQDPYRQYTAIGDIGRLKLSDQIIYRVQTPHSLRLREASYNIYYKQSWRVQQAEFKEQFPATPATWQFSATFQPPTKQRTNQVQVTTYLPQGKGLLALPHGTYQISQLAIPSLQQNPFGVIKVEGPYLINYHAHFGIATPLDSLPTPQDLQLPTTEKTHLLALAEQLNLTQQSPTQVLNTLSQFFQQHFHYSLELTAPTDDHQTTPLNYFLTQSRAGHCEYFATATVLLLRTVGIPTRYATGYLAEEYSELEQAYIVRRRHAHAWTLVYLNQRWQEFDTTPASWLELEAQQATWWQPLNDIKSWIIYQFYQWRSQSDKSSNHWLLWLILPLGLMLIWRLYRQKKVAHSTNEPKKSLGLSKLSQQPGADSPFYQVIQKLNQTGYQRQPGETLTTWLTRIHALQSSTNDLSQLLTRHQRYRFYHSKITAEEKQRLTEQVARWLANY
jgi:transglutaminase-like putative cysteine protease